MNEQIAKALEDHQKTLQGIVHDIERHDGPVRATGAATICNQSLATLRQAIEESEQPAPAKTRQRNKGA